VASIWFWNLLTCCYLVIEELNSQQETKTTYSWGRILFWSNSPKARPIPTLTQRSEMTKQLGMTTFSQPHFYFELRINFQSHVYCIFCETDRALRWSSNAKYIYIYTLFGIIPFWLFHLKRIGSHGHHRLIKNCGPQTKTIKFPDRLILKNRHSN
jgi:hypothetical protein